MELWKRGVVVYVGSTLAFVGIAECMKTNSGASSRNAVWLLVSTIRNVLLGSWVLLLAGAAVLFLVGLVIEVRDRRWEALEEKQREEKRQRETLEGTKRQVEDERSRLEKRAKELEQLEQELRARYEARMRELEIRKARTTEQAVDSALDDFG